MQQARPAPHRRSVLFVLSHRHSLGLTIHIVPGNEVANDSNQDAVGRLRKNAFIGFGLTRTFRIRSFGSFLGRISKGEQPPR